MSNEDQLAWEARAARPAALAAFGSALIGVTAWILYQTVIADRLDGTDGFLKAIDDDPGRFVLSGVLQAIGLLLLVPPLLYLARAVRARRAEFTNIAAVLVVIGALGFATSTVLQQVKLRDIAHDFFPFEPAEDAGQLKGDDYADAVDPEKAATKTIRDELPAPLQGLGLGATFALAFSTIMIALNAMRTGLLSRFMGALGIAMGVMFVIPIGIQPVLQLFWFGALGVLLLGRWPGGRGPAWETGEAIPWPSAAQRHAPEEPEPDPDPEPEAAPEPETPRPKSRKRKKKRR